MQPSAMEIGRGLVPHLSRFGSEKTSANALGVIPKRMPSSVQSSSIWQRARSPLDEGEKILVDDISMRGAHAMREFLVDLQSALLEELCREQRGIDDRHDVVVVAMHNERRHVDEF